MKVNSQKQLYIAGYVSSPADFDMGPGFVNLGPSGFLAKYDEDKNLMWGKNFSNSGANVQIKTIYLDGDSIIYLVGDYVNTFDADPSDTGYFPLTSVYKPNTGPTTDVFIIKLTSDGNFIWACTSSN